MQGERVGQYRAYIPRPSSLLHSTYTSHRRHGNTMCSGTLCCPAALGADLTHLLRLWAPRLLRLDLGGCRHLRSLRLLDSRRPTTQSWQS